MSFRDSKIISVLGMLSSCILILGLLGYLILIFLSKDQLGAFTQLILLVLGLIALGLVSKLLIGVVRKGIKCQ
jgi:hypothetical protein